MDSDFHICLSDSRGLRPEWYLQLVGGFKGANLSFLSDDVQNIYVRSVGKVIGDFDEQRDWRGGRGGEYFSDDPAKFFDAQNCWTLMPNRITPSLLPQYATGLRTEETYLPGSGKSVSWKALILTQRYISSKALGALTAMDKARIWIKRVGNPGTLTLEIRAASGGQPNGTVRKTATVTTATVTDYISTFYAFDWSGTQNITSGDFIVLYGASTDDAMNHWEVAVDAAASSGFYDDNGSGTWTAANFKLYYRIVDADIARKWFFFTNHNQDFCAVSKRDSGNSDLYTIDSAGAVTSVSAGLGVVYSKPAAFYDGTNVGTYFPQGGTNTRKWTGASTFADDGTNKSYYLMQGTLYDGSPILWGIAPVSVASQFMYYTPANPLATGGATAVIADFGIPNSIVVTDGNIYAFLPGTIWRANTAREWDYAANDWSKILQVEKIPAGFESMPSTANGACSWMNQQFIYFPFAFSLLRYYNGISDDVGQGWDTAGMPSGREGFFVSGCAYVNLNFIALDAGTTGTSCVMCYDGVSWHEVFRAPAVGLRIRGVGVQVISGARAKLWIDLGGDLVYIILPWNKARPIDDSSQMYVHEAVLISSTIDNGLAAKQEKLVKSLTAISRNLSTVNKIDVDFQTDADVGTDTWTPAGDSFLVSPESTVKLNLSGIKKFRYRLRIQCGANTTPPEIQSVVPNGLARGGVRFVWTGQINGKTLESGGKKSEPEKLLRYLMDAMGSPGSVRMTSTNWLFHDFEVELALQNIQPINPEQSAFVLNLVAV